MFLIILSFQLYHQDLSLTKDSIFHDSFIVDEDLNGILSIRVSYDTDPGPQLKLKDPNGKMRNDIDVDTKLKVLHFTVDTPEVRILSMPNTSIKMYKNKKWSDCQ